MVNFSLFQPSSQYCQTANRHLQGNQEFHVSCLPYFPDITPLSSCLSGLVTNCPVPVRWFLWGANEARITGIDN